MSFHTKQYTYLKVKLESNQIKSGDNVDKIFDNLNDTQLFQTQQDFLNILLHTADISNPTKPWQIYQVWVEKVMEEFWNQGDKEKELKLPVSFLCDRKTVNVNKAQLGFIDGIVMPLLSTVCDYFPGLNFLMINCKQNKEIFQKLKEQEETYDTTIGI